MIDKVKMSTVISIPQDLLDNGRWRPSTSRRTGSPYYVHLHRGLRILYYPHSQRLILDGRLISASIKQDPITNLDALLAGVTAIHTTQQHTLPSSPSSPSYRLVATSQNLDEFIAQINQYLTDLTGSPLNIFYFRVTRIEICFNILTPHAAHYIELFNLIYAKRDPQQYVNFVLERHKPLYGSLYVKSKSDFRDNVRRGTIINFYNKKDQLKNKLISYHKDVSKKYDSVMNDVLSGKSISPTTKRQLTEVDDSIRHDAAMHDHQYLRMEVQLHHKALYDLLGTDDRSFGLFLDINYCRDIVNKRYARMLGSEEDLYLDFFSLSEVYRLIDQSEWSHTVKINLRKLSRMMAQNHELSSTQLYNYKRRMTALRAHWYPIPSRFNVDRLISPMQLLDDHIASLLTAKPTHEYMKKRDQIEAELYNSIEDTDEGMAFVESPTES